ncbi:MAG TPA: hypothetical protein VFS20_09185 [Longimicrobium sp.]|nr:hypothetical protein [Longimicrobium sp.]
MMKGVILAAVLVLSPLSRAAAQPDAAQRIEAARQRAAQAGIPVQLLNDKVAEGRAKNVPEERIAAAVVRRLASLERARAAMRAGARPPALSPADLSVGADALENGVDPAVLGRLAQSAPQASRAQAIAVLTQLVQQGVASEQALARVTAALADGAEALRQLPGEAGSNNGQGNANRGNDNSNRGNDNSNRGNANGNARRGPPDVRGPANAAGRGGRAGAGGGPPSTVPGPGGKGRGHGQGQGKGKP